MGTILRVGLKVGRTLYDGDKLVGLVDTPELACEIVAAVNAARYRYLTYGSCPIVGCTVAGEHIHTEGDEKAAGEDYHPDQR